MKSIVASLDISKLCTEAGLRGEANKSTRSHYGQDSAPQTAYQPTRIMNPRRLAVFLEYCMQCSDDLAMQLSLKIVADIGEISVSEFRPFWVPVVQCLISTLESRNLPLSTHRYHLLACCILDAYITCVGKEPRVVVNHSQPPLSCGCRDCTPLNVFLRSSTHQVWRFPAGKGRRQHLHNSLDASRANCTHVTSRGTNPNTLVVTKGLGSGGQEKKTWEKNFADATAEFADFDQAKLSQLLKSEYNRITGMQHLRRNSSVRVVGQSSEV